MSYQPSRWTGINGIVVGSGAAGSNMAARMSAGGKRVLILEAGPARTAADLISSTLYARRVKWTGEVWTGPPGSMHIMGGTVMGTSAANSATNGYGQLHDIPNLVIAGPGLFPTSGGVNPTFTVHALAARSAQRLLATWKQIAA